MHESHDPPDSIPSVTPVSEVSDTSYEAIPRVIPVPTVYIVPVVRPSLIPSVLPVEEEPLRVESVADNIVGRGHPWLAWLVLGLTVTGMVVLPYFMQPIAEESSARVRISVILMRMQGRYLVGASSLTGKGSLYAQAKTLNVGTAPQRLRFAALAGELSGPKEALAQLERLGRLVEKNGKPLAENQRAVKDALERLYRDYAGGRLEGPSLSAEDRAMLRRELDWFGDLALNPDGGPDQEGRRAILISARWTMAVMFGGVALGGLLGVAGLGLLVLVCIQALSGNLRSGLKTHNPDHGIYVETFALWMLLFLLLGLGLSQLPGQSHRVLLSGVGSLASLAALGWPVLRGIPWARVRQDIGWTGGINPLWESALGVAAYAMSLPLLGIGFMLTVVLMGVQSLIFGTPNGQDSLSPTGEPQHPIVEFLSRPDWWLRLQVLFVASIAAPIVEETMFRGVLYRHLRDASHRWPMILSFLFSGLLTSFVFAVIHPQGWVAVPALGALALGFTIAREWRGTLLPAMVAHGINNGALLVLTILAFGG